MNYVNDVNELASVKQPRALIMVNSILIDSGIESATVTNNRYASADTFEVRFNAKDLPGARNLNWFTEELEILVNIYAGFPSNVDNFNERDLDLLIYGRTDRVSFDVETGVLTLSGRDLTSLLIDTKTSEHFANQKSSDIALMLAKKHSLTPVITATKKLTGAYYTQDHVEVTQEQSEWDLISYLAKKEEFKVFVKGNELHFEPIDSKKEGVYLIDLSLEETIRANAASLQFERELTVARGITVEVRSWNAKQKKGFSAVYPVGVKRIKAGQSVPQAQAYKFTVGGLTPETAQQLAQQKFKEITAHEMSLTASMVADNILNCEMMLEVANSKTSFDQRYFIDEVSRSIGNGYTMNIKAKNRSPETAEQIV